MIIPRPGISPEDDADYVDPSISTSPLPTGTCLEKQNPIYLPDGSFVEPYWPTGGFYIYIITKNEYQFGGFCWYCAQIVNTDFPCVKYPIQTDYGPSIPFTSYEGCVLFLTAFNNNQAQKDNSDVLNFAGTICNFKEDSKCTLVRIKGSTSGCYTCISKSQYVINHPDYVIGDINNTYQCDECLQVAKQLNSDSSNCFNFYTCGINYAINSNGCFFCPEDYGNILPEGSTSYYTEVLCDSSNCHSLTEFFNSLEPRENFPEPGQSWSGCNSPSTNTYLYRNAENCSECGPEVPGVFGIDNFGVESFFTGPDSVSLCQYYLPNYRINCTPICPEGQRVANYIYYTQEGNCLWATCTNFTNVVSQEKLCVPIDSPLWSGIYFQFFSDCQKVADFINQQNLDPLTGKGDLLPGDLRCFYDLESITTTTTVQNQTTTTTNNPLVTTSTTTTNNPLATTSTTTTNNPLVTTSTTTTNNPLATTSTTTTNNPLVTTSTTTTNNPLVTTSTTTTNNPLVTTSTTTTNNPLATTSTTTTTIAPCTNPLYPNGYFVFNYTGASQNCYVCAFECLSQTDTRIKFPSESTCLNFITINNFNNNCPTTTTQDPNSTTSTTTSSPSVTSTTTTTLNPNTTTTTTNNPLATTSTTTISNSPCVNLNDSLVYRIENVYNNSCYQCNNHCMDLNNPDTFLYFLNLLNCEIFLNNNNYNAGCNTSTTTTTNAPNTSATTTLNPTTYYVGKRCDTLSFLGFRTDAFNIGKVVRYNNFCWTILKTKTLSGVIPDAIYNNCINCTLFQPFYGNPKVTIKKIFSSYQTESLELRLIDDYFLSEQRALNFTSSSWPSLLGSSVFFKVDGEINFTKQMIIAED
jgi:hypothetical protein